jgi:hypothetical protein
MSLTVEQLEAARAERMRQNGHGAITIEDVRTWIEETGLCIFLPRSAQAGFTAPTFVEAVAGQRTTEPTLELIATAESLLVRLEAEGVAVRLNLAGQPGDQPDYVVAGWVLPYIYALRGDRDWRRSPQLTGSRQVSQLAVQAAKQLDSANQNAGQVRDALGREVTETAVLRALHELWKQLRIIPVVPEVGTPALWQPLRQRFQKAIAEGASTSQVTAISVLASIYLQAVIAASMEDVEMFLSPLTSRSKIREVVRGLAATRQVHSTTMGQSPMFYVAGTLPEFPAVPSYQINTPFPPYRGSSYLGTDPDQSHEEDYAEPVSSTPRYTPSYSGHSAASSASSSFSSPIENKPAAELIFASDAEPEMVAELSEKEAKAIRRKQPLVSRQARPAAQPAAKAAAPRPRSARPAAPAHPRERSRTGSGSGSGDARRAPISRNSSANGSNGNGSQRRGAGSAQPSNGTRSGGYSNGNGNSSHAKPAANGTRGGNGLKSSSGARPVSGFKSSPLPGNGVRSTAGRTNGKPSANGTNGANGLSSSNGSAHKPTPVSASKRYSFSGQAKQAPKPAAARNGAAQGAKSGTGIKPAGARPASARPAVRRPSTASRPAEATKRRG